MKSERGQALIEFVLIVPVLAIFILGIFDIGNVIYKKYQLENDLDYIVDLYKINNSQEIQLYLSKENIQMSTHTNNTNTTITLTEKINFVTPGATQIFGNSYSITTQRTIINES